MKKKTKKVTLSLCLIIVSTLLGWEGMQKQSNAVITSTVILANIEALANSESSDCRFEVIYNDPYTGNCHCAGYGDLCCEC